MSTTITKRKHPLSLDEMIKEEFDTEIQKGFDSIDAGNFFTSEEIHERFKRRFSS